MPRKYAAFISYRHKPLDIAVAKKLHKSIEQYRIPRGLQKDGKKRLGIVFRDRDELPLSNNLTEDIFEALDNTEHLIVICTPDTPKSLWVRREIQHFLEKHGRDRVFTVLAAGTPEESIPKEITTRYAEDGVTVLEEYEPLCANLAEVPEKKVLRELDKELPRLYAAMLGCPYDQLVQREQKRRIRRILTASAAILTVALGFTSMLLMKNQEIAAQKRDVQLRESELLAADAEEAMLTGNTLLAIESAVNALPKEGEEDRPYYAPAERVLMDAMDILGGAEAPVLLKNTVLEQMTPISHFALSTDGSLAVTIDQYGVLHGFDTVSGKELWSDILSADMLSGSGQYVLISENDQNLICKYYNLLECRDPKTGQIRWTYEIDYAFYGYLIYDDIRDRIAIMNCCFSVESLSYRLELTLLSAETGEIRNTILLEESDTDPSYVLTNISSTRMPKGGTFSDDGRYFACAFSQEDPSQEVNSLACFVVDLENGTVLTQFRQALADKQHYYVTNMVFRGDDLLIALETSDDSIAASVLKLDWKQGKVLWHTTTPSELESFSFSMDQTSSALFWDATAIVGRYEKLYSIDLETGELLHSVQLPGNLSYLYTVSSRYFGFSLSDGTYAVGWHNRDNGFVLTSDYLYQVSVDVEEHSLLLPYGSGIVQCYTDGNYFEISVSNVEREGYLAVVPSEHKNQIVIKRPIAVEKAVEQKTLPIPVEQLNIFYTGNDPVFCTNNTLILGSFYVSDESSDSDDYFYIAIDRDTHEVTRVYDTEDTYGLELYFLPDGSGYVQCSRDGTTLLYKDGTGTTIAEKKDREVSESTYYTEAMIDTDTARLSDGTVLTVHCGIKTLTLIRNGVETTPVPLPEEHQYQQDINPFLCRYVQAGQNGSVLTYCYTYGEDVTTDDVMIYTGNGIWTGLEGSHVLPNTSAFAFAQQLNRFAAVDGSNTVRIYDLDTGKETAAFPLQLPCRSVLFMDFVLDDSCLIVKTQDAQILIYEIATGQILYQEKLATSYNGILHTYEDTANQRLYIIDSNFTGNPNGICVDLRSWTTLGTGSRMVCFDETSGELFHFDSYYGVQDSLSYITVPSTGELVRLGQQMLAAQ